LGIGTKTVTIIIFLTVTILISSASPALAETFFPTHSWRLDKPPTFCIIQPSSEVAPKTTTEGYINRFYGAVSEWSQKLIAEDLENRNNWLMKSKTVSEVALLKDDQCDIAVRLQIQDLEAVGRYCPVFYSNNPSVDCNNPPKSGIPWIQMFTKSWGSFRTDEAFFSTAKHEVGHSFGLGHYYSDDDDINKKWVTTVPSPSIMITPGHSIPELRTITAIDVSKIRSLYGTLGFITFSPTPTPTPTPIPTPIPTPTPTPTPKPLPKSYILFDYIELSGKDQILRPTRSYETVMLKITGQISESQLVRGLNVYLLVISPSQTHTLKLTPTAKGYFETPFVIDKNSPFGEYRIQGIYQNKQQIEKDIVFKVLGNVPTTTARQELYGIGASKQTTSSAVSGIGEFDVSFSDDEYTFSGFLGGYNQYVRLVAENECPFKKQVHKQDYSLSSKINTEASFTFYQMSQGKPSQCTIYLTMSDFYGKVLDQTTVNYKIQTSKKSEITQNLETHPFAMAQKQEIIPSWIKEQGKWWTEGSISDNEFINAIQYMIKERIIVIPPVESGDTSGSPNDIPDWIKNTVNWWSLGEISDQELVGALQYLIRQGIIVV